MKRLLLFLALASVFSITCRAESALDAFRAGLQAFEANGPDSLFRTWYRPDEETRIADLRARLTALSSRLGPVVDTEIFAPKAIGKRLTRLYGVIYFHKRPLWLRADYYTADGTSGFVALEFSLRPDEIFPMDIGVYAK